MENLYFRYYKSPAGCFYLESDGEAVTRLDFGEKADRDPENQAEIPVLQETARWLDDYFAGKRPEMLPQIRLSGTSFQKLVWKCLEEIPYGNVTSYGEIAARLARENKKDRMSAQAVGQAVGANPVAILVPCHRVVGASGSLTGYAGGLELKKALLQIEGWKIEEDNRKGRISWKKKKGLSGNR